MLGQVVSDAADSVTFEPSTSPVDPGDEAKVGAPPHLTMTLLTTYTQGNDVWLASSLTMPGVDAGAAGVRRGVAFDTAWQGLARHRHVKRQACAQNSNLAFDA